jgi:hypothetical protein
VFEVMTKIGFGAGGGFTDALTVTLAVVVPGYLLAAVSV